MLVRESGPEGVGITRLQPSASSCVVFSGARRKARNLADVILCDAPQAPGKQVLLDSAREDLVYREHRAPARLGEMGAIQPPLQPQHL